MAATTIDETIAELGDIIDWARDEKSRLGYFAAMYRTVTVRVKRGIELGQFENGERMEHLDVVFANRYLDALRLHRTGDSPTESWQVPFAAAERWRLLVIQHLFAGMNAHINLDLGIAAAEVAPGDAIHGLEGDFKQINHILRELTHNVHADLASIWPLMHALDMMLGRFGDQVAGLGMKIVRDTAWNAALRLAAVDPQGRAAEIAQLDRQVAEFGREIISPSELSNGVTTIIRLGELKTVRQIIDTLARPVD